MNEEKIIVNVFWTGGLDSTCRICELALLPNVVVQPYYLKDPVRDSVNYELRAINTITEMIRKKPSTKCELRDIIIINVDNLDADDAIRSAWNRIHQKYNIGTQYDWLARFLKQRNLVVEMSLEESSRSRVMNALKGECQLLEDVIGNVKAYRIDLTSAPDDAVALFANLRFPVSLWHMTKEQEVEWLRNNDFLDVAKKTWFCYRPVFGMPCGHCNPCRDALNEGMAFRVPMLGRILGGCMHYTFYAARHVVRKFTKKF